jgi:hypothetical protein
MIRQQILHGLNCVSSLQIFSLIIEIKLPLVIRKTASNLIFNASNVFVIISKLQFFKFVASTQLLFSVFKLVFLIGFIWIIKQIVCTLPAESLLTCQTELVQV